MMMSVEEKSNQFEIPSWEGRREKPPEDRDGEFTLEDGEETLPPTALRS
jgi:hypothetical protein